MSPKKTLVRIENPATNSNPWTNLRKARKYVERGRARFTAEPDAEHPDRVYAIRFIEDDPVHQFVCAKATDLQQALFMAPDKYGLGQMSRKMFLGFTKTRLFHLVFDQINIP
jgi:hypothetical protein